jgi:hypothetical protein
MGKYIALSNFHLDAQRIAKKGELLELGDGEALELLRNGRVQPADEATSERFRREAVTTWAPAPEPTAAAPGSWLSWRN